MDKTFLLEIKTMDKWFFDLFHKPGIPPLYFGKFVMLISALFYQKSLKDLDKLSSYRKRFI